MMHCTQKASAKEKDQSVRPLSPALHFYAKTPITNVGHLTLEFGNGTCSAAETELITGSFTVMRRRMSDYT